MATELEKVIDQDKYVEIAEAYSNIRTNLIAAREYLFDACYTIVKFNEFEPTLDLLQTFYDVYRVQWNSLADSSTLMPAVKALNSHVMLRARDDNDTAYATINDWFGAWSLEVPQAWIDMSTEAGFAINNVYAA